jgi:hypothetical protein
MRKHDGDSAHRRRSGVNCKSKFQNGGDILELSLTGESSPEL